MKIGNSFLIAKGEIRNEKLLFLIFSIITILLFSVSVAIMDAAVYLPEHISKVVHENMLDCFFVNNYKYPEELEDILDKKHISFNIESCSTPFTVETPSGFISGEVLFQNHQNEYDLSFINDSLTEGVSADSFYKNSCVLISDRLSEQNKLHIGGSLDMVSVSKDEKRSVKAEICGVYEAGASERDFYISDGALRAYLNEFPDNTCAYVISPKNLRNIFSMKTVLEDNGYIVYSEETLNTIRMLYITLYSVNIILILALAGSVYNFINIYLQRRKKFYAVQSAIGMSDNNIMKILFSISELIVLVMLACSTVLSLIILRIIIGYADGIFAGTNTAADIPFIPISLDFLIVQLCLAVIMLKFRKRLKSNNIIKLLHEK